MTDSKDSDEDILDVMMDFVSSTDSEDSDGDVGEYFYLMAKKRDKQAEMEECSK